MLPIINTWDDLPFSFTTMSCSGTLKEHPRKKYGPVNGYIGNPHALIFGHSYMAHPTFNRFNNFLEDVLDEKEKLSRSEPFDNEEFKGIYLHIIDIFVPKEHKKDSEYLVNFWKDFHTELGSFSRSLPDREKYWSPDL